MDYQGLDTLVNEFVKLAKGKPKLKKKPKGWKDPTSVKKYWKTLTEDSKHPWQKCVDKLKGDMKSPEGFCAKMKDVAKGTTKWRGEEQRKNKGKKRKKKASMYDKGDWVVFREYKTVGDKSEHYGWNVWRNVGYGSTDNAHFLLGQVLNAESWEDLVNFMPRNLVIQIHKSGVGPKSDVDRNGDYIGVAGWLDDVSERPWGEAYDSDPQKGMERREECYFCNKTFKVSDMYGDEHQRVCPDCHQIFGRRDADGRLYD